MSAQEQARALMMRHHHLIKNRQQALLTRTEAEVGMPVERLGEGVTRIQGKPSFQARQSYDRSGSALS